MGGQIPAARFHSPAYSLFVITDPAKVDLVGVVAYGVYKQQKIEWLQTIQAKTGNLPTANDEAAYAQTLTPTHIRMVRQTAESYLSDYASVVVEAERSKLESAALEHILSTKIDKGFRWGRGFWQGLVVNVVSIPVVFVLAIALLAGGDLKKIFNGLQAFYAAVSAG